MLDPKQINEMVKKLVDALPAGLRNLPQDVEKNFKQVLQGAFSKMDLVTREEFDAQAKVLTRTREKLEQLERKLRDLEKSG